MKHTKIESYPKTAFLHFEAVQVGHEYQVDYELVLPLEETDCRGTWDHKGRKSRPKSHRMIWLDTDNHRRIPLGRTKAGTHKADYPFWGNEIELPFRDGAHCMWDNEKLGGLPIIYSVRGEIYRLEKETS